MNIMIEDNRDFWWACVDICVLRDRELTPIDKAVYAVLCTYASVEGRCCYPSVERVAEETGCSLRSAQQSIKKLEQKGYLVRESRYKDRRQISSRYKLVGHRGGAAGAGGRVQQVHPGGAAGAPELEPLELEPEVQKITSPSEREETSREAIRKKILEEELDPEKRPPNLTGVPSPLKTTAELLLLKTGRRSLTSDELLALKQLERYHIPSRIQTEIAKAVERYARTGKSLKLLTFEYIWNSLKHQRSKPPLRAEQIRMQKPEEKQRLADLEDWERRQQEELTAKFGGEGT